MINLIVAVSKNNVIGINNTLPWKLSADLKRFKELTSNNSVIMGRKTYESIGKPLPNRKNFVITSNKESIQNKEVFICNSLENALHTASLFSHSTEIFIIGGGQIYKEAIEKDLVDKIYLTSVDIELEGDTFFPVLLTSKWDCISNEEFKTDEKNQYDYSFSVLTKK